MQDSKKKFAQKFTIQKFKGKGPFIYHVAQLKWRGLVHALCLVIKPRLKAKLSVMEGVGEGVKKFTKLRCIIYEQVFLFLEEGLQKCLERTDSIRDCKVIQATFTSC